VFHIGQERLCKLRLSYLQPLQGAVVSPELIEKPYVALDVVEERVDIVRVSEPVERCRNATLECDLLVDCPRHISRIVGQLLPQWLILHKVFVRIASRLNEVIARTSGTGEGTRRASSVVEWSFPDADPEMPRRRSGRIWQKSTRGGPLLSRDLNGFFQGPPAVRPSGQAVGVE
jgi:hypothetical protein